MPKMKTHSGAAKRFRKTGTGKIKRSFAFTSHILTSKTTKTKRNYRRGAILESGDSKRIHVLLPN